MSYVETRAGQRWAREAPQAVDFLQTYSGGWSVVSPREGGWDGRGGLTAHRGALHRDEWRWLDLERVARLAEAELGFTRNQLHQAYRQGRKSAPQRELRARIDARFLELRNAGSNLELLARVTGVERKTIGRALKRALAAEALDAAA
jgi:hypothetical protein